MLNDSDVDALVHGTGVHFYFDTYTPAVLLDQFHRRHPDKFMLNTEACSGMTL